MGEIPLPNFFTLSPEDSPLSEAAESIPQHSAIDAPSENFNIEHAVLPPVETFDVHPIEIPETPLPEPTSTLSDDLTFDLFPASFGAVDPSSPEPPQPDFGTDLPAELFPTSFGEDPPPSSLKTLSDVPPPPELTAPIASPPPAAGLETLRMPAIGATSFLEEGANPTARSSGATYPIIPQSAPAQSFTDKNATNKAIAKNEPFSTHRMVALENISAPPSKEGETFGDYTLIDRVAVGGMAEVWRARRRGVEGFQKTVAIKRILSHLTDTPDFITMFIDEAKLAAQLSHNHIIQIYDLGKVGDDFFIAMEFVDGKDLRSILDKARKLGRPLPIELALMIVAALARALDYAHRKKDFENRAMGLVHRDVSPQNVLISYEGEIKLCDFGIVKAVAKASTTQMGALKGKLQYMSPEQAWGKSVDGRSDIFSLGSVLFEVLTGERLFTGDSELNVLDSVRECRVRSPRDLVPDVPEEVDQIVHRALTATPEERYQTAKELEQDIKSALDSLRLTPSQGDLATYVGQLFNPPLEFHNYEAADTPAAPPSSEEALPVDGEAQALPNVKPSTKADSQRPRKWLLPTLLALALAAITALAWFAISSRPSPEPTTAPADIATPKEPRLVVQDGELDPKEAAEDGAVDSGKSAMEEAGPEEGDNAEAGTARGTSTTGEATDEATMEEGSPPPGSRETSLVDRLVEERLAETEREIQRKYDAQLEAESQRLKRELERAQKNLKNPPKPPPQEMNPDQFDTEESDGR
jgi:serine/threonine protein kinase